MKKEALRICTITHHTVPNYGAVLQAYALQHAISDLGYDSEILNYQEKRVVRFYHQSFFAQNSFKEMVRHLMYYSTFKKRNRLFSDFIQRRLKISKKYYIDILTEANHKYDLFITGSDQVWNLALHQNDTSYFLDFVEDSRKKGSYAASFGYSILPEQYREATQKNLSTFSYINVREESGVKIAEEFTEKDVHQVVDPTLLLSKEHWKTLIKPVDYSNYILVYEICRLDASYEYAQSLANQTGKRVIAIKPFDRLKGVAYPGNIEWVNFLTPEEFLSLIYYADYIVTSSFHGTVFSILFEKKFFCTMDNKKSATNGRITSLLSQAGLDNRLTGMKDYDEGIDYEKVAQLLKVWIENSRYWLSQMLENVIR